MSDLNMPCIILLCYEVTKFKILRVNLVTLIEAGVRINKSHEESVIYSVVRWLEGGGTRSF